VKHTMLRYSAASNEPGRFLLVAYLFAERFTTGRHRTACGSCLRSALCRSPSCPTHGSGQASITIFGFTIDVRLVGELNPCWLVNGCPYADSLQKSARLARAAEFWAGARHEQRVKETAQHETVTLELSVSLIV
jgi:hypothetical protein